jgi:hypothetical protein
MQTYEGININEEEKDEIRKQIIFRFPLVPPSGNASLDSEPRNWLAIATVVYCSDITAILPSHECRWQLTT